MRRATQHRPLLGLGVPPHIRSALGSVHAYLPEHRPPRIRQTACLLNSREAFPRPPGESATVWPGSPLIPGVWLAPGRRRAAGRINGVYGTLPVQSRRHSKGNGTDGQPNRGQQWNTSSHLIRLLYARHGSGYGDGIRKQSTTLHPQPEWPFAKMTAEREEIYRHVPYPGELIPVEDPPSPFSEDDYIPEDEEIAWEVLRIHLNCSGGPSGMQAEHLYQWLIASARDASPDATNWLKVVAITKEAFKDGTMAKE